MTEGENAVARPDEIPDWVPDAVKAIALAFPCQLLEADSGRSPIGRRLLLDARMKSVWTFLRRRRRLPITESALAGLDARETLSTWNIDESGVTLLDRACAAFFVRVAYDLCRIPEKVRSRSEANAIARPRFDAANILEEEIRIDQSLKIKPELVKSILEIKRYLEERGRLIQGRDNIYVLQRSAKLRNDNRQRVGAISVSRAAHSIFGDYAYGTTAVIVSVAFGRAITAATVRDQIKALR